MLLAAAIIVAAGRPEYSHGRQTLSELGAVGRPGAVWMNALGIVPAGFLVLVCSLALRAEFGRNWRSTAGTILLGAGGASLGGSGLTPWQGGLPPNFSIPGNVLHATLALAGFLLIALAPMFFGLEARRAGAAGWSRMSIAASLAILCLAFAPGSYPGATQRAALGVFYVWLVALSLRSQPANQVRAAQA
jgi:hypothetical membrane protein